MTKDEFPAISGEKYEKLQELNQIDDFYKYEKAFDAIWLEFGRQSLEKNVGEVPQNHQKKRYSDNSCGKACLHASVEGYKPSF